MLTILTALAFAAWFVLLYPLLRRALARHVPPLDVSPIVPIVLLATFAYAPLVFNVERDDGTALLEQGLTISNKIVVAIAALAGIYALWQIVRDKRVPRLLLAMPYLPFTIMIIFDGLSTFWSIVPSYTAYRTVELAVLYLITILVLDRNSILRSLPTLMSAFILIWLVLVAPIYTNQIAHGIIFSSAKNNVTPALCFVLLAYAIFLELNGRARLWQIGLSLLGLLIAGSAASTAALAGFAPAIMVASRVVYVRVAGIVLAALSIGVFIILTASLSNFPWLLHFVSAVLQKPELELVSASGRNEFWPVVLEATRGRYLGSGFAAGDRFLQLLISPGELRRLLGDEAFNLNSAHNMFLSAWVGTGFAGIGLALAVLGSSVTWAMKLPLAARRFALSVIFLLVLNGMTTPGLFSYWNVNIVAFVAVLAFARVAVGRLSERPDIGAVLPTVRLSTAVMAPATRAPP